MLKKLALSFALMLLTPLFAFALAALDLNSASVEQLTALPGIGAKTAEAIVAARPYKSVDDLKNVKGIGTAKLAKLQGLVSVGSSAPVAPTAPAAPVATAPAAPAASTAAAPPATAPATAAAGRGASRAKSKTADLAPGSVNVNSATEQELERLPGIGPVKAKAIIAARPIKSLDDLDKVKGIGPATLGKLKTYVTF